MKILVTGSAGFIGYHLSNKLLENGHTIVGLDNMNNYYDVSLKEDRLKNLKQQGKFTFHKNDLVETEVIESLFEQNDFDLVIHLAAQAGVRYSIENPRTYVEGNVDGFFNVIDAARRNGVKRFFYASSSSVYGNQEKTPYSENDQVDLPISLYAATKKSNELFAHVYSHIYGMETVGLRFFTVYGPFGRPDMAYFKFANKILDGDTIDVYNNGELYRDFTYVDDIVGGIVSLIDSELENKYNVFNIGNNSPVKLLDFVNILQEKLEVKANIRYLGMQQGDVYQTFADIDKLSDITGYTPSTNIEEGLEKFVQWYMDYYKGEER